MAPTLITWWTMCSPPNSSSKNCSTIIIVFLGPILLTNVLLFYITDMYKIIIYFSLADGQNVMVHEHVGALCAYVRARAMYLFCVGVIALLVVSIFCARIYMHKCGCAFLYLYIHTYILTYFRMFNRKCALISWPWTCHTSSMMTLLECWILSIGMYISVCICHIMWMFI